MCSKSELLDDVLAQFIPKTEPIDVDSIKKEVEDGECFVVTGLVESFKVDKGSVKEENVQNEEAEKYSPSKVYFCL